MIPACRLEWRKQRGKDFAERLARAFRDLLRTHPKAVFIGTDSPELSLRLLRRAIRELEACDAVLGPCPDGGYYVIGLRRFDAKLFIGVRWGSRFTFRDTVRNLIRRRFSCSILDFCPDLDRPEDFTRWAREMKTRPSLRRLAPAAWRFVRGLPV